MKSGRTIKQADDARLLALLVVCQVTEKGAYTNLILDKQLRIANLSPKDRHLVTELVNGTIRMLKHLDWVLNLFMSRPITTQNPWLRNILRISLYQILFMDSIPDYAIINSAVEMTRMKAGPGLAGLANGVLRNIARQQGDLSYPAQDNLVDYYSVYYSQPEWLVAKLLADYGEEQTRAILEYYNRRPLLVLRANTLKASQEELGLALASEGIKTRTSTFTPYGVVVESMDQSLAESKAYQGGLFYVQNEASMLAVSILDPQPGEYVIDLCCGVGGKATFAAQMMNNQGFIDAFDIHKHKIDLLQSNCGRLGMSIVSGHQQDILTLTGHSGADRVILDAPCSGLGVLNRRADARWRKTPEDLTGLQALQLQMLTKAGQLVKPDGNLVYCTCTINRGENEDIILAFLNEHPDYKLEGFRDEILGCPLDDQDVSNARGGMLTIIPGKYQTDGMFYAKVRRTVNT